MSDIIAVGSLWQVNGMYPGENKSAITKWSPLGAYKGRLEAGDYFLILSVPAAGKPCYSVLTVDKQLCDMSSTKIINYASKVCNPEPTHVSIGP